MCARHCPKPFTFINLYKYYYYHPNITGKKWKHKRLNNVISFTLVIGRIGPEVLVVIKHVSLRVEGPDFQWVARLWC